MPLPEYLVKHHEKTSVELTIDDVVKNSDGKWVPSQVNRVKIVASVQAGIDKYRSTGKTSMTEDDLENEKHDSGRLGEYLDATVMRRPPRCHAHAVVSGNHAEAAELRVLLALYGMRIDDPHNGCWLPENTAATPHPAFPKAVPHSRIHRFNYYFWLKVRLNEVVVKNEKLLIASLNFITQSLHEHTFPEYVMLKKGQGLPRL